MKMNSDSYTILLSNKNTELYILTQKDQFLTSKISHLFALLSTLTSTTITNPSKIIETLRKWRESLTFKIDSLGAYLESTRRENLDQQLKFGEIYASKFDEILENLKKDKNISMKIISEGDSYYIDQIGTLEKELERVRVEISEKRELVGEMRGQVEDLGRMVEEESGRREGLERVVEGLERKGEVWREYEPLLKDDGLMGRLFNILEVTCRMNVGGKGGVGQGEGV
jgi:chromosome segregation ATPase